MILETYQEGQYTVLELTWYDSRMRRPENVRAGMDRDRVLELIRELQELLNETAPKD